MPFSVGHVLLVALAGALGTLLRFGLAGWTQRLAGPGYPWGTVVVNLAGCFAAGLLVTWIGARAHVDPTLRAALLIGFLGAFTTFSTFIVDADTLRRTTSWLHAGGYILLQNAAGLLALGAGIALARAAAGS